MSGHHAVTAVGRHQGRLVVVLALTTVYLVAEVVADAAPVEENDADAAAAKNEAAADETVVPEHKVESDEAAEAKIEAEAKAIIRRYGYQVR